MKYAQDDKLDWAMSDEERVVVEFTCDHDNTEVRRRTVKGGAVQYVAQCVRCGATVGTAIAKHRLNVATIPPYDEAMFQAFLDARAEAMRAVHAREKEKRRAGYAEYLRSPEWRQRRAKVISRCNNTCEGCGEAAVDHVHHLTYDNVGQELLFQLVGLCNSCHHTAHHPDGEGV